MYFDYGGRGEGNCNCILTMKKTSISITEKNKLVFLFHRFFPLGTCYITSFISLMRSNLYITYSFFFLLKICS